MKHLLSVKLVEADRGRLITRTFNKHFSSPVTKVETFWKSPQCAGNCTNMVAVLKSLQPNEQILGVCESAYLILLQWMDDDLQQLRTWSIVRNELLGEQTSGMKKWKAWSVASYSCRKQWEIPFGTSRSGHFPAFSHPSSPVLCNV